MTGMLCVECCWCRYEWYVDGVAISGMFLVWLCCWCGNEWYVVGKAAWWWVVGVSSFVGVSSVVWY